MSSRSPVIVHGRTVRLKLSEEKLCVFVGNLDTSQSPEVLQQALHHILDPIIPVDAMTIEVKAGHDGLTRGYGFVTCRSQPFAELVRQMLGASSMSGRPLVAKWADSQKVPAIILTLSLILSLQILMEKGIWTYMSPIFPWI